MMMKKRITLALLAVLLLTFGMPAFAADEEWYDMNTTLLDLMDMSTREWMASEEVRCSFAILGCLDVLSIKDAYDSIDYDVARVSYCGRDDDLLVAGIGIKENGRAKTLMIIYAPGGKIGQYMIHDSDSSSYIELVMKEICGDGYYVNSIAKTAEVAGKLSDVLNS